VIHTKVKATADYLELNLNLPAKFKETIIKNVNFILSNYYDSVDMIVLFGSCARGNPKLNSDIDILILSRNEIDRQDKIDIRAELCETVDRVSSDIIFYTFETFKNSTKRIVDELKKDGAVLWKKE
jgi:predicted nucleotidyltransferase